MNCHPIGNKPPHDRCWWEQNQLDPHPFVMKIHTFWNSVNISQNDQLVRVSKIVQIYSISWSRIEGQWNLHILWLAFISEVFSRNNNETLRKF